MVDISLMTKADIPFAAELSEMERWGDLEVDYHRIYGFEPEGCFIAREDERRVGMITSITYGDYAFLANLIVSRDCRGRGIGTELMKRVIYYVRSRDIENIELDGEIRAVPIYRRLGFKDKYLSLRFLRRPSEYESTTVTVNVPTVDRVVEFDHTMTGLKRGRVIRRFCEEFARDVYVVGDGGIDAYAIVRPAERGVRCIGPAVAKNAEDFESLIRAIVGRYHDHALTIGVPEVSRDAVTILLAHGFCYTQPSLRMYVGDRLDYEKHICAITAPNKG
ncbi:MAG: GNAT family N-acetyltransferase [candidate division Zixibacteria bacterium]|nr:GNAT family N-acetyltransferase [candidate division Zixibacteria bacterium]